MIYDNARRCAYCARRFRWWNPAGRGPGNLRFHRFRCLGLARAFQLGLAHQWVTADTGATDEDDEA